MKKYLMTWYGITDFRASIELEQTTGPVLGALLAESFTDVVLLGYTNAEKVKISGITETFKEGLSKLQGAEPLTARQFVNRFANTDVSHEHFIHWLERKIKQTGKNIMIHFVPVTLKHLNDTEGIYVAAITALDTVAATGGNKQVTLYLSPGTPVMAFVWAFAALRYPNLKKRLIASSQPDKPPEVIVLPEEWLEWHGRQILTGDSDINQYDVIFHLFGEQRIPNLLGVTQFSCRKHIFINSEQYPAQIMKQFIGEAEYTEVSVDPYDPENVRATILELIARMPSNIRIGFNLTGGTKLMYAGALSACRKVNATPFYFNSRNNQVIYLNDFKHVDTKLIPSVETFIKLNGNNLLISKSGHWNDIPGINDPSRRELTKKLWVQRSTLAGLYQKIAPFNDKPGRNFQFSHKHISAGLKDGHQAEIIIQKNQGKKSAYRFQNWPDFARYLTGGWFEEYIYMGLQPLIDSGLIKDIRIGLEVSFKEEFSDKRSSDLNSQLRRLWGDTYQELDVVFTDGRRLYIIECKAGSVKGEYVRKLESITRYFGGIAGRGILACCFRPNSTVVKQKVKEAGNLQLVAGKYLFDELDAFLYKIG